VKFGSPKKAMYKFSDKSIERLNTCHPDLIKLFNEVIKGMDCSIICGYRGEKEQNLAYESGYSQLKYPDSKHNKQPSLAVDVLPYPTLYSDSRAIYHLAGYIKGIAEGLGIKIQWGGDWKTFIDAPHWELMKTEDDLDV
jgi:hypothetical protein